MKRLVISRYDDSPEGAFGIATLESSQWDSLELPWHDNKPRISCIPFGIYTAELAPTGHLWSPRTDGQLYRLKDVPGRDYVEIHAATWAGDVSAGWHTDLQGCIALGMMRGRLKPADISHAQDCILSSRIALSAFMDETEGEPIEIEVKQHG